MFLFVYVIGQLLKMTLLKLFLSNLVIHISVFPSLAVLKGQDCCWPTHLQIQGKLTSLVIAQMVEEMKKYQLVHAGLEFSPLMSMNSKEHQVRKNCVSWIIWGQEWLHSLLILDMRHASCLVNKHTLIAPRKNKNNIVKRHCALIPSVESVTKIFKKGNCVICFMSNCGEIIKGKILYTDEYWRKLNCLKIF